MTLTGFLGGGAAVVALGTAAMFGSWQSAIVFAIAVVSIVVVAGAVCIYALRIGAPLNYRQLGERGNHSLTLGPRQHTAAPQDEEQQQ